MDKPLMVVLVKGGIRTRIVGFLATKRVPFAPFGDFDSAEVAYKREDYSGVIFYCGASDWPKIVPFANRLVREKVPVVVISWSILSFSGFDAPFISTSGWDGDYMKSVRQWLKTNHFVS